MKRLQLSQNTPEWLELRRLKIGASDCATLMGEGYGQTEKNKEKKIKDLWKQKHHGKTPFVNDAMRRGSMLEPMVLAMFNSDHGTSFQPACFVHDQKDWMMASFDGFDETSGTHIEIKCPSKWERFEEMAYRDIPKHYMWQLQHQLAVSGGQLTSLVVFFQDELRDILELKIRDVHRDESMISSLMKAEEDFFERYIIGFESP